MLFIEFVFAPALHRILNSGASFCCIDPNQTGPEIELSAANFNAKILIVLDDNIEYSECLRINELLIFNRKITIYQRLANDREIHLSFQPKIMFKARTSGTTGEPKIISVPYNCIIANVESLW